MTDKQKIRYLEKLIDCIEHEVNAFFKSELKNPGSTLNTIAVNITGYRLGKEWGRKKHDAG